MKNFKVEYRAKSQAYTDEDGPSVIVSAETAGEAIEAAKKEKALAPGKYYFRVCEVNQEPTTPKQYDLPLVHFAFQEYLGGFKRMRKALGKACTMLTSWKQLPLKLYVKTLFKAKKGFYWTRPDGRQFFCPTIRALVTKIMNYDGHLLQGVLKKI